MHGDFVDQTIVQYTELYYFDDNTQVEDYEFTIDSCVRHVTTLQAHTYNLLPSKIIQISKCDVKPKKYDYNSLHPLFGWLPADFIKQTCMNTTKYNCMPMIYVLKNYLK